MRSLPNITKLHMGKLRPEKGRGLTEIPYPANQWPVLSEAPGLYGFLKKMIGCKSPSRMTVAETTQLGCRQTGAEDHLQKPCMP